MTIMVTGGSGMVGHALQKLIPDAVFLSSKDGDLRSLKDVEEIFCLHKPHTVIHLAARVGGLKANMDYLGEFYYDNILINTNVLEACRKFQAKKVISVLSTCVYPDNPRYPLTEEQIHNGPPHSSNYPYAHVKRMLDVQSRAYRDQYGCNFTTIVPNNLFGTHDNFHLENSHVLPAIIRKVYEARKNKTSAVFWGDGLPLREFTFSNDLARIIMFLLEHYNAREPINVGNIQQISIKEIVDMVSEIYNFQGEIIWDTTAPTGQLKKPSTNKKLIQLGWKQEDYTDFCVALKEVCEWFENKYPNVRGIE